jgi:uncharacterized protein YbcI
LEVVPLAQGETTQSTAGAPARQDIGELSMAISREMVILMKDYLGRGPTRARTYVRDNVIAVVLQDTMTKAEHKLVEDGKVDAVRDVRRVFQETLRHETSEAIERLTGRKVISFLSDHDVRTDIAAEVFLLDPLPEDAPHHDLEVEGSAGMP